MEDILYQKTMCAGQAFAFTYVNKLNCSYVLLDYAGSQPLRSTWKLNPMCTSRKGGVGLHVQLHSTFLKVYQQVLHRKEG